MNSVLPELNARLDELEANLAFVAIAVSLRPRLGSIIKWTADAELVTLARNFMAAKASRAENLYGAILLRSLAAFERFARQLVDGAVGDTAARAVSFDDLPAPIRTRNITLTGRLLANLDEPRDYQVIHPEQLIDSLASCVSGSKTFRLNGLAFTSIVVSGRPPVLERAFANLGIEDWWDAVGRTPSMQTILGTTGARATGRAASERLKELWRLRNMVAHAGDEEVVVSEADLRAAITFIRTLSAVLEQEIVGRLR